MESILAFLLGTLIGLIAERHLVKLLLANVYALVLIGVLARLEVISFSKDALIRILRDLLAVLTRVLEEGELEGFGSNVELVLALLLGIIVGFIAARIIRILRY